MEKKRSVGVTVVGIFHILGILPLFIMLKRFGEGLLILDVIFCVFVFLIACGVLSLKNIARIALVTCDTLLLIGLIPGIVLAINGIVQYNFMLKAVILFVLTSVFPIVLLSISIFYLTRPKVKRQFTGAESPQQSGGDKGAV